MLYSTMLINMIKLVIIISMLVNAVNAFRVGVTAHGMRSECSTAKLTGTRQPANINVRHKLLTEQVVCSKVQLVSFAMCESGQSE
jgi:hypothetical protein